MTVPWDAPEAVVDVDSEERISLGSFPDKVGLFGRHKEAAVVSRIMAGRDSRSDERRELRPNITCQMVPKTAPLTDTGRRQCRLKSQAFVGNIDIQNARILLEVPVLRMPNVFLELAEEARNTEQCSSIGKQVIPSYQYLNRDDPG